MLLFLFCVISGEQLALSYEEQYKKACMVSDMLFDIKTYISFEAMTLKEIICELKADGYDSFSFISKDYYEPEIRESLTKSLNSEPVFKNNEYNAKLNRLFCLLGTTDKQTQLELIESTISYFTSQAEALRRELAVKKRLYRSLGFSAGALISVLLL